ncbi:MAG: hypothetical protein M3133_05005 [Actinomycetota bacterium]|nr:hypothetical protein [Actinomycetota bacterium]
MSVITVAVVASILVLTLGALVAVALGLVRQVKALMGDVQAMQARLEPSLDELSRETAVTERELGRLGEIADEMRKS